jgi:hypothetical protein
VKIGHESNSECACAKLCGRVIAHNRVPDDRGSCTEEPCEIERLTHGSESEVRTERFLPTVTYRATRSLETDVCKGQREDERESP